MKGTNTTTWCLKVQKPVSKLVFKRALSSKRKIVLGLWIRSVKKIDHLLSQILKLKRIKVLAL